MKSTRTSQRNQVRGRLALPPDVDLNYIDWKPTVGEKQAIQRERTRKAKLEWLAAIQAKADSDELAFLRRKVAAQAQVIAADREWLDRQKELEEERAKVKAYYEQEHAKEEKAADKARLERLKKATDAINKDNARAERAELLRRGVVRGRRK